MTEEGVRAEEELLDARIVFVQHIYVMGNVLYEYKYMKGPLSCTPVLPSYLPALVASLSVHLFTCFAS